MEGAGSRFGRASSRYGSAPTPAAFSGPVRKWKKQWVSTRPAAHRNAPGPTLFLCRWIPLPAGDSTQPQMSPKRKFRYAPIVDLEEKKREALKKVESEEADTRNKGKPDSTATFGSGSPILKKHNINDIFNEDFQDSGKGELHPNKNKLELSSLVESYN